MKQWGLAILVVCTPLLVSADTSILRDRIADCSKIRSNNDRLACFDRITNTLPRLQHSTHPDAATDTSPCNGGCDNKPVNHVTATTSTSAEFGTKYLSKNSSIQKKKPQTVEVTLVQTKKNSIGQLFFYFHNGQIWRQLETRHTPLPRSLPAQATITQSVLNSYSLRIGKNKRMIKIKRIK